MEVKRDVASLIDFFSYVKIECSMQMIDGFLGSWMNLQEEFQIKAHVSE